MFYRLINACAIAVGLMIGSDAALAYTRVALIIGNSAYRHFEKLPNPRNDAESIAKLFTAANFDIVDIKADLTAKEFHSALQDFAFKSAHADVAVVYFAGHGVELYGTNYLIPVDAKVTRDIDRDIDVVEGSVSLNALLRTVNAAKRLRLIILDACRDNPFAASLQGARRTRGMTSSVADEERATSSGGLAVVQVETSDTYVAFAAKAGSTALDGDDTNSPFTKALLNYLTMPGLDVRMALGKVRDQVVKDTNRRQEPYVYGSLGGEVISLAPTSEQIAALNAEPNVRPPRRVASNQQNTVGSLRSMHGNWQVRCILAGTPPKEQCASIQAVNAPERSDIGLTAILLKGSNDGGLLLRVLAPAGVLLPSGLGLKIDGNDIGRAGFVRCLPNGCVAEIKVDSKLRKQLSDGKKATFIIFQTPDNGIGFPMALPGFSDSVDAISQADATQPAAPALKKKGAKLETKIAKSEQYPLCTESYEASYRQSLEVARSVNHYPTAMIAQHRRQCGY